MTWMLFLAIITTTAAHADDHRVCQRDLLNAIDSLQYEYAETCPQTGGNEILIQDGMTNVIDAWNRRFISIEDPIPDLHPSPIAHDGVSSLNTITTMTVEDLLELQHCMSELCYRISSTCKLYGHTNQFGDINPLTQCLDTAELMLEIQKQKSSVVATHNVYEAKGWGRITYTWQQLRRTWARWIGDPLAALLSDLKSFVTGTTGLIRSPKTK